MLKHKPLQYLLALAFLVILVITGYGISRDQTESLFTCYALLFAGYLVVVRKSNELGEDELNFWIIASLLFRASLLFSIPALSDDFYRFIWDGRVLAAGENPFQQVPSYYMDMSNALPGLDQKLFEKLNSPNRFSSYPPVCQFIYWLSVKLSPDSIHGSVLVMKNILLLFEIGTIWIIKKLVTRFDLSTSSVLIYALNPLVILEISGNLHFEGVMIFFLMVAIYFIRRNHLVLSCIAFALSVCTKLIPLIFLPLLYHPLGIRKAIIYWALTGIAVALLYLPFIDTGIVHGYTTSLAYYFQHFEFNGSIYYLVRGLGYALFGYNTIEYAGPILAILAAALVLMITFRPRYWTYGRTFDTNIFSGMVWCLFAYFLLSTIVHPWYIITLLAVSIFTTYRFPLVWTGVIFLTYAGYTKTAYSENWYLITLEYLTVIFFFLSETIWTPRPSPS